MIQPWEHRRELVTRNGARVWVAFAVLAAFAMGLGIGAWMSGREDAHHFEILGVVFVAYLLAFALYNVYAATQRL